MIDPDSGSKDFYVVGGTLEPDAPSYIKRKADQELFDHILAGDFCFVLTPRQLGKSSMMARTARRLQKQGIATAIVDLTQIGTEKESKRSADKWYYGIAHRITRELDLRVKLSQWWGERKNLPALQRLTEFFSDVILKNTDERVVVFIDEIDTTISLPFTDDFFAAIRACYNARATESEYERLSFVLLGVASPSDLIKDSTRTPFNIGQQIDLTDFTFEEAKSLAYKLCDEPDQGELALKRILYWTEGHPYLTQKLCGAVAKQKFISCSQTEIDTVVDHQFFKPETNRSDSNLNFVRNRFKVKNRFTRNVLKLYQRICNKRQVTDEPLSPIHTHLKLSGLVKPAQNRALQIRNKIYQSLFNSEWAKAIMPVDWNRIVIFSSTVILLFAFILWYSLFLPTQFTDEIQRARDDVPIVAYQKLHKLPGFSSKADNLLAQYWERRSLREEYVGNRDEAILCRIKALQQKDTETRRQEVKRLAGNDYENLLATYHHEGFVYAVAFSPDGKTVLTGSWDNTARLWRSDSGQPIGQPMKHEGFVSAVAFCGNNNLFAMTSRWIHKTTFENDTLTHLTSRVLPGSWMDAFRFLDANGNEMQVALRTCFSDIIIDTLRFDIPNAPPIEGNPDSLLEAWEKKLALKFEYDERKIVAMWRIQPPPSAPRDVNIIVK